MTRHEAGAVEVYVALGSNLADPHQQVLTAFSELDDLPRTRLLEASPLYASKPVGPPQPDYVNAVARLSTQLEPLALLDALQAIEQAHGRLRGAQRWGARTLDLDLLLYGDECIDHLRLQVPHPLLCERAFVLYPLADVAPADLSIPGCDRLDRLLARVPPDGIARFKTPFRAC